MRKSIKIIAASLLISLAGQSIAFADYEWAMEAVNYCVDNEILSGDENGDLALGDNLTREQMSRILVDAFDRMKEEIDEDEPTFSDVDSDRWSYGYIESFAPYMKKKARRFKPEENVTREEFASSLVLASGLKEGNIRNPDILEVNFKDYTEVDADYKKLM